MKRARFIVLAVALPALAITWYLFRPERLFIDLHVSEPPPMAGAAQLNPISSIPRTLAAGTFVSDAHETKGTAEILEVDGTRFLRLSDFSTSNGPDVHVYLVKGDDASSSSVVRRAQIIDLGVIKGNIGDQNYELPDGYNLDEFRAVSIWCKRFSVNFGGAPLRRT